MHVYTVQLTLLTGRLYDVGQWALLIRLGKASLGKTQGGLEHMETNKCRKRLSKQSPALKQNNILILLVNLKSACLQTCLCGMTINVIS